jgi:hypothetical protein
MDKSRQSIVSWLVFPILLSIYLAFPTRNYFWDGIDFAQTVEDTHCLCGPLIHPSHLVYNVFGYLAYKVAQGISPQLRALAVMQFVNSVLSVLAACVFFLILQTSLRCRRLSLILTLCFACSVTWWKFSTDADAYVPAVLCLLITFYLLLPGRPPRPLLVALTFSASMCFHQLAVVFYPVMALGLWLQQPARAPRRRAWLVVQSGAVACLLTAALYYGGFRLQPGGHGLREFAHWITYHSPDTSFTFSPWSSAVHTLRGQVRLFVGGRFNYIAGLVNPLISALLIGLVILAMALGYELLRSFRRGATGPESPLRPMTETKALLLLCGVWILSYNAFLFVWLPFHTFYRLFYLPAVILAGGILLVTKTRAHSRPLLRRVALLTAIMAGANFLFLIFPYAHVQKNPPLQLALGMNKLWLPGTVIYYGESNTDNRLCKYFYPALEWRQLTPAQWDQLEGELQRTYAQGHTAWLEVTARERIKAAPGGPAWLDGHTRGQPRYELHDPAFKISYVQVMPLQP